MGRVERRGFWISIFVAIIKPLSLLLTRRRWTGREHVPTSGGVIFAVNHVSYVDFVSVAHFVYWCRRIPRFMAKSEVFGAPVLGTMLRGARQIPVYRSSPAAGGALRDAVAALAAGRAVVIYPEGTITGDPDYWPMLARTGVARLALSTGAPVIPVAQWGPQRILGRDRRPRPLPRRTVTIVAGPPVDLTAFAGRPLTAAVLRGATDAVGDRIRAELAAVRGETPPELVWNPRTGRREPPALVVPAGPVAPPAPVVVDVAVPADVPVQVDGPVAIEAGAPPEIGARDRGPA